MNFSIQIIPFIIGTIFNMVLGALWYSNVFFAKAWMAESGVTQEDVNDSTGMGKVYGFTTLTAFLTSFFIGFLVLNLGIHNILEALILAIVIWLGADFPMIIKNWGFESRSIKLGFINHGYQFVVYLFVTILFVLF